MAELAIPTEAARKATIELAKDIVAGVRDGKDFVRFHGLEVSITSGQSETLIRLAQLVTLQAPIVDVAKRVARQWGEQDGVSGSELDTLWVACHGG